MNLISGKILDREQSLEYLNNLKEIICNTLTKDTLSVQHVITACDILSVSLNEKEHLPLLLVLGITEEKAKKELALVKHMMCREYLESRIEIELSGKAGENSEFTPFGEERRVKQAWKPLGVLLHIAAGNVDALPVFSVIEGLLTGNINILKLPGTDDGLSIAIIQELIKIQPEIANYVFVFDYPSEDIESIQKLAKVSDAIVIWGGDSAVRAVRAMADPDTRVIEWGHKISFAYVSGDNISDEELKGIAYNMCDTEQLFCNSCQGIYLDTDDYSELIQFGERFMAILDSVSRSLPGNIDAFMQAKRTLELKVEELESVNLNKKVFHTDNGSVIVFSNKVLEPSYMFRNCWIKPLAKEFLLYELLKYKNHLQTVALVCGNTKRREFEEILLKTGIVRITSGQNMSKSYCGIPHDGEFPLQRYMKKVSYEY